MIPKIYPEPRAPRCAPTPTTIYVGTTEQCRAYFSAQGKTHVGERIVSTITAGQCVCGPLRVVFIGDWKKLSALESIERRLRQCERMGHSVTREYAI